jgi:hypothetical protein
MENISSWMKPDGYMFVHIFVHKQFAYHFVRPSVSGRVLSRILLWVYVFVCVCVCTHIYTYAYELLSYDMNVRVMMDVVCF